MCAFCGGHFLVVAARQMYVIIFHKWAPLWIQERKVAGGARRLSGLLLGKQWPKGPGAVTLAELGAQLLKKKGSSTNKANRIPNCHQIKFKHGQRARYAPPTQWLT